MSERSTIQKVLEILANTAGFAAKLDPESIDFSTAIEEMKDCTFLLEEGFSEGAVFSVANQTTSDELYDLLKDEAKPAGQVPHDIIVTIEEHTSRRFTLKACNAADAMKMAEVGYHKGDLVVQPTTPTARRMMAHDTATGETTEWIEF